MKKFFFLIISIIYSVSLLAKEEEWPKIEQVSESGMCGKGVSFIASGSITRYEDGTSDGSVVLTISGNGAIYDYESTTFKQDKPVNGSYYLCSPWRIPDVSYSSHITKIVINEGVTSIGDCAFYALPKLESVLLPQSSLGSIGSNAFASCVKLNGIDIPSSVQIIGDGAFEYCSLKAVSLNFGLVSIGTDAFSYCNVLSRMSIPGSVKYIGPNAFAGCSSLQDITIPTGVKSIEEGTFFHCTSLARVTLNEGVESIGSDAFFSCGSLKYLTLPSTLNSIGEWAFYQCYSLESVTLPEGLAEINERVFGNCTGLSSVEFSSTVTSIGEDAFAYTALTNVEMPASVLSIGYGAFYSCKSLESVSLGNVQLIDYSAFAQCSALKKIEIPVSVVEIKDQAFECCESLESVSCLSENPPSCETYAFSGVDNNIPLYVPEVAIEAYHLAQGWSYFSNVSSLEARSEQEGVSSSVVESSDESAKFRVCAVSGRICCDEQFVIFDLAGRDVTSQNGNLQGIYIVVAGDDVIKISVTR